MSKARVAIVGGGPGGSTLGTLLKRYMPDLRVSIFEREKFPRDHVGESQVPAVCAVLDEMGVWDTVERAGFPIKVGATYRWGRKDELWDFEFLPGSSFVDNKRPGKYEGQRKLTAWQIDRSIYDEILLDHAASLGCEVREGVKVEKVLKTGNRIDGLVLDTGETIVADHYVDCSGNAAIIRKAMGVPVEEPALLRNVAFWDYWRDAEWAVRIAQEGTRIQIMSLDYGWIWFITIGSDRTSIGVVVPAEYYKKSGMRHEELYMKAVYEDPRIADLIKNARREEKFYATKDWSYIANKLYGDNWYLCGECAGFADPILSQGLTITQTGARHLAYTIIALERGKLDREWLLDSYERTQMKRVLQHIRFADFWYSANGQFHDLVEHTRTIAADAGLHLDADSAFRWLGTGGFTNDDTAAAGLGQYTLSSVRQLNQFFTGTPATWEIGKNNVFKLDLEGAEKMQLPFMSGGRITPVDAYKRGDHILARQGFYSLVMDVLMVEHRAQYVNALLAQGAERVLGTLPGTGHLFALETLEVMIHEGWVKASHSPSMPLMEFTTPEESRAIHTNRDSELSPTVVPHRG